MKCMAPRVPDEYFRVRAGESGDVGETEPPDEPVEARPPAPTFTLPMRGGVPPRRLVVVLLLVLVAAFILGKLVFRPAVPDTEPVMSPSPVATSGVQGNLAPFDGSVKAVEALEAHGECQGNGGREVPSALLDDDPATFWRCPGDGKGESIVFMFDDPTTLVGLRLINGNTVWTGRFAEERRILRIRWEFSDGSYFVQGLTVNNRGFQEVRFPEIQTRSVNMRIEDATDPGGESDTVNAVSISSIEFLAPA